MEKNSGTMYLLARTEVSYVYDPQIKRLSCEVTYNGTKDSFCAIFDEHPHSKTVHEFISGFILFLQEKQ